MSDEFDAFLNSNFFSNPYNAWHDGLDLSRLTRLQGDDLTQAEELLLKNLPDSRAVVGLGEIRSQKAIEPLNRLLNEQKQSTEVAVALLKINEDAKGLDAVITTMKDQRKFWSERMDAAIALRNFRSTTAVNALLAALDDPQPLVRYHAAISLLVIYGQTAATALDTPQIAIKIMREYERAAAATELRQMVSDHSL